MGFWNSVKNIISPQTGPAPQPILVQVPLSELPPELQQRYLGMQLQPQQPQMKKPSMISQIWKTLNTPMFDRGNLKQQSPKKQPFIRGPQPLTYPLPPINKDKERRGIW